MASIIKVINIALFITALVLVVNLIQPLNRVTGNIIYSLDKSDTECYFNNVGGLQEIPVDRCCYEIQKQLTCESTDEEPGLKCYTSEISERYYLISHKTLDYCKKEGYDVKIE